MAISYVNTIEVENIQKELILLANEFNDEINKLFLRFSEVPTITKEWVGNQAVYYFRKAASDKQQYNDFANKLKDIGYKLSMDMYEVKSCLNKSLNEES